MTRPVQIITHQQNVVLFAKSVSSKIQQKRDFFTYNTTSNIKSSSRKENNKIVSNSASDMFKLLILNTQTSFVIFYNTSKHF